MSALVVLGLLAVVVASCQSPHPTVRKVESDLPLRTVRPNSFFTQVSYQEVRAQVPEVAGADFVKDDEMCAQCHTVHCTTFGHNVHRTVGCEGCHGPASKHLETRGKEPGLIFSFKSVSPAVAAEACLKCHEQNACTEGARWRTSKHAACGVSCTDCHRAHYNNPPNTPAVTEQKAAGTSFGGPLRLTSGSFGDKIDPKNLPSLKGTSQHLAAVSPYICYRCHGEMQDLQAVAHPHQICGPNGFNCTTCHDAHGNILESTRTDLCLKCHNGAPTMAWHSSIHSDAGVACVDCHNPHPKADVRHMVDIQHTDIRRPKRLPMSVDDPGVCFKCHPKIFALTQMPSHHPIREGKMVCGDCHDPHGQKTDNLKEATVNLLCYKCHADKQGPFAFEHPPVRENCGTCHNPHGTVANNLLKQPTTFLCLRCHTGHNGGNGHPAVSVRIDGLGGVPTATQQGLKAAYYTDCTQCHSSIHGTNRISQRGEPFFTR